MSPTHVICGRESINSIQSLLFNVIFFCLQYDLLMYTNCPVIPGGLRLRIQVYPMIIVGSDSFCDQLHGLQPLASTFPSVKNGFTSASTTGLLYGFNETKMNLSLLSNYCLLLHVGKLLKQPPGHKYIKSCSLETHNHWDRQK